MSVVGFEDQTVELNPSEVRIAQFIASKLKYNVGRKHAATNKRIRGVMTEAGHDLGDAKIRKVIQYIRQNNLCPRLCATSNGYFVAETKKELDDYITSLRQRKNSIEFTLECFERFNK